MLTYAICPFCKNKPQSKFFGLNDYLYCSNCKLAWLKKFPEPSYGDTYYKGTSTIFSLLFSPVGRFFYWLRSSYVGKKNIKLWVDVGAGEGSYLKTVPAEKRLGIEISASGRRIMENSGLKTMTEKQFLKYKSLKADVISFWHVLEHVENPWMYLGTAYKNLADKGLIIIGIPNFDSFEFQLFKRNWFHLVPKHHLWHFSPKAIRKVLSLEGFKIIKIDYWSLEHHLTGILQSFINKTSGSDSILHRLIKRAEDSPRFFLRDAFWSGFWLTVGLPVVVGFWIAGALFTKSGTIIILAEKKY